MSFSVPFPIPSGRPSFEELARTLFELTSADQFFIYRRSDSSGPLDPVLALGSLSLPEKQAFWASQIDPAAGPFAGSLDAPDRLDLRTHPILAGLRSRFGLLYPLTGRGQLLGLVLIGWLTERRPPSEAETRLAAVTVHAMALELDNQRLVDEDHQQRQQARISQEIQQAILRRDDLAQLLQFIAGEGLRAVDALGCAIRLIDAGGRLQLAAQVGQPVPSPLAGLPALNDSDPAFREPVVVYPDSQPPDEAERSLVRIVPLLSGQKTLGVLELVQIEAYARPKDLDVARSFAGQAAVAVELDGLYQRLRQTAVAEERARLARDLHDSISQSLYAMTLYTRAAQRRLSEGRLAAVEQHLQELHSTAREVLGEMRLLIFELRPMALTRYGLKGILEQRLQSVEARSGLEFELEFDLPDGLSPAVEDHLYHIALEALNNTIKHASAGRVWVALRQVPGAIRLTVKDDGAGFDPRDARGGLGLKNIQERASALRGRLSIEAAPGAGVAISVEIPDDKHSHSDR